MNVKAWSRAFFCDASSELLLPCISLDYSCQLASVVLIRRSVAPFARVIVHVRKLHVHARIERAEDRRVHCLRAVVRILCGKLRKRARACAWLKSLKKRKA